MRHEEFALSTLRQSKSRPVKTALAIVADLRSKLALMDRQGIDKKQRNRVRDEALAAIALDVAEANAQELERLHADLASLETSWHKQYLRDAAINDRRVASFQRHFAAMSAEELRKEAALVMQGARRDDDPAILDELSAAVKYLGDDELHTDLRSYLQAMDYARPWAHSEAGKALSDEAKYLEQAKGNILLKGETGGLVTMSLNEVEELLSAEAEASEAENV